MGVTWAALTQMPAFWGFAGAFIFAGPQLNVSFFTARAAGSGVAAPLATFVISMLIGTICAEAFCPALQAILHHDGPGELRAIAAVIGLLGNPAAPVLIDNAPKALMNWLGRLTRGSNP